MFTGFNDFYLEGYTQTDMDKYRLWTEITISNLGWLCSFYLREHVIWGVYGDPTREDPGIGL